MEDILRVDAMFVPDERGGHLEYRGVSYHVSSSVARLTAERDECQKGMYENAVEIKTKIAMQVEELNTVIRQKWEIEGQLERCAKSVKALVKERDTLLTERDQLQCSIASISDLLNVYLREHNGQEILDASLVAVKDGVHRLALRCVEYKIERDALRVRNAEHEQFRHQHRDCDKLGCELQALRAEVEQHVGTIEVLDAELRRAKGLASRADGA